MKHFSEEHILGVPEIDDQHKKLFNIIASIYKDIVDYEGKNVDRHLIDLVAYSTYHFKTENKYLEDFIINHIGDKPLCDDIRAHISDHKKFPEFITGQIEKYALQRGNDDSKPYFLVDIAIFLNKWIDEHILRHDKLLFNELMKNR
jgi:hemerythrin-like metal-binding protein